MPTAFLPDYVTAMPTNPRRIIYKYTFTENMAWLHVMVPPNSRVLSAGPQRGNIVVWVEQDLDVPKTEDCYFQFIGTGNEGEFLRDWNYDFISTVQIGSFVFHVYRVSGSIFKHELYGIKTIL
jgi:hypothetical protein